MSHGYEGDVETTVITLEEAQRIVSAAENKAQEMDLAMNVAVTDAGRNLLAFHRMDGAWVASIDIAIDKAFTSAGRGLTTREIGEMAQPGRPLFGINTTNGGRIVIFAGGIPLMRDGEVFADACSRGLYALANRFV